MVDKGQIQQWLDKLRAGMLVEDDLQQALNRSNDEAKRQRLLYLHARTTGVDSEILGMALVENGQVLEGPDDPTEWPYNSVLEAIDDGWRVIKFPEMALLLQEDKTFGLGCEFILEKLT
ncbi:MAG: hypothetical protein O7E52_01290 [Candidatus Poribacteria bacterium]|nr:hypothetical protein [Candidatus Poribacteria bacterium]